MKMDAQYLIEKLEAIPEDQWTTDVDELGRRCALGHCGMTEDEIDTEESLALAILSQIWMVVLLINEGGEQQATPKQRILAALRDAKERGL